MEMYGIRWEQRFSNFKKALKKLEESVGFIKENFLDKEESILSELVKQGLIQGFEFTHELAWNVMKDYLTYQGNFEIRGSRDATREGFSMGLISDGEIWMEMIKSRNQTSHTYDETTADEISRKIMEEYLPAFFSFKEQMEAIRNREQGKLT
jgi:nucleotidyltransferase substrate binding protein (TIGR01987 family)